MLQASAKTKKSVFDEYVVLSGRSDSPDDSVAKIASPVTVGSGAEAAAAATRSKPTTEGATHTAVVAAAAVKTRLRD